METLHLYPQAQWHDEAYVIGTRESLLKLRDAIDSALATGSAKADCFTNDGEGYSVIIRTVGQVDAEALAVPYTDEIARETSKSARWPWGSQ